MRFPNKIKVVCRADGAPVAGVMASVTIKVRRKTDFGAPYGPSDAKGLIDIAWAEVEEWARNDVAFFPMDYIGLGDATGEIVISVQNRAAIDRALNAYQMFRPFYTYPRGYEEKLLEAQRALGGVVGAVLSVEVEHDGEGMAVRTPDVPA